MIESGDKVELQMCVRDGELVPLDTPGSTWEWLPAVVEAHNGIGNANLMFVLGGIEYRLVGVAPGGSLGNYREVAAKAKASK